MEPRNFSLTISDAYDIRKDAVNKLADRSCDEETERKIYGRVMRNEAVVGIDPLHTRIFGNKIYVDIKIAADGSYTLKRSHKIAEEVRDDIERELPKSQAYHGVRKFSPGKRTENRYDWNFQRTRTEGFCAGALFFGA